MAKSGIYYAGRVLKLGILDQLMLMDAIRAPATIKIRENSWTFIDITEHRTEKDHFIFGRLSKYSPEGEVGIVDEATKSERKQDEPNLIVSSTPFIYIPEHSGIVFMSQSGGIDVSVFTRRFCQVIEQSYNQFFVDCGIELISDLKSFSAKLGALDGIFKIEAMVSPPNPLFSPLWKKLEEYLRSRNTDRMRIIEDAPTSEFLKTDLPKIVEEASAQTAISRYEPGQALDIGDAAILMAADGYGRGIIRGRSRDQVVIIKTSEAALNFVFDKTPNPEDLYSRSISIFESIKENRHMEHGE